MASLQDLQRSGWYLTSEGLQECVEDGRNTYDAVTKAALDIDLKEIGEKHLPESNSRSKNDSLQGPIVLQIQKLRNVSAPKENPDSQAAPPLLRMTLTDGHSSIPALEMEKVNKLTPNTPPGVKLKLTGRIQISNGFLLLNKRNCEFLGGRVEKLVENWQLKRTLANQTRFNVDSGGSGPPPFIPFGQRNRVDKSQQGSKRDNFKSLEQKEKDVGKKEEDKEFMEQRKATIKAVMETKEEAKGKYFGSGSVVKPNDRDIAKIVEMGFTADQAVAALKQTNNHLSNAITALLRDKEANDPSDRDRRAPRPRQSDRSERPDRNDRENERIKQNSDRSDRGRGRRGREADEDDEYRKGPSAPSTLFDYLRGSLPAGSEKEDTKERSSGSKEGPSKSYSTSSESSDKRGSASGPPNLPPRLVKQQRAREEERIRRLSGGGAGSGRTSSTSSPGLSRQQAPPNPSSTSAYPPPNRPQRPPPMSGQGGRYHDQGPRGPMRPPYQQRPPFPGGGRQGGGMRMDGYGGGPHKRVYDPHNRGQPQNNRGLWNESDGGRRGYRDNRNNYEHRYVDRDYHQGPPPNQRRGPNQRYDGNYQGYSNNRQGRDNNVNQYSSSRGQYSEPPHHHHQYGNSSKQQYESEVPNTNTKSYKETRQHVHHVEQSEVSVQQQADQGEANPVIEEQTVRETSHDPDSAGTQESESSVSDTVESNSEVIQPQQVVPNESAPAVVDGYTTEEVVVDETQYSENDEEIVQYDDQNAVMTAHASGPTYVYADGTEMTTAPPGGYVQVAAGPPGATAIIPQMQAMNISGVPASGAPLYATPYGPAPMSMEQMYSSAQASQQMYTQQVMPSMEYSNSSMGVPVVTTTSTMVNGSKQKNTNDSLKQNVRQWKNGDYCVAKYWEDQKFYRAIIQQSDPSWNFCYVTFPDYGNTEQVLFTDIRPVPKNAWETNQIQSPAAPMSLAAAGMLSPPAMPMAPPGILIQNPPTAMSFVSTPYQDPTYQGSMVSIPAGSIAFTPQATSLATGTGAYSAPKQHQVAQQMQQQVYVQHAPPQMQTQIPSVSTQMGMMAQPQHMTSQSYVKKP